MMTSVQEDSDTVHDETDEDEDNNNESGKVSYTSWIAFGFRLSERCPVPIDSDKRRSIVNSILHTMTNNHTNDNPRLSQKRDEAPIAADALPPSPMDPCLETSLRVVNLGL
ncbi:UNVERIFIED_CONTAM: hypothetical protein NCL1_19142 [Trichonephila clavipes]